MLKEAKMLMYHRRRRITKGIIILCSLIPFLLYLCGCPPINPIEAPAATSPSPSASTPSPSSSPPAVIPATLFYVSTCGNDANPGSSDLPWRTLQKAANSLLPNETVIVRQGFYPEALVIARGGAGENARLSFVSDTPLGAKCLRIEVKANWVSIDGFEIEENAIEAGLSIHGSDYTTVNNCYIHDCPMFGIMLRHAANSTPIKLPSHFKLSNNLLEHNGQVGIRIKGSYGLVENNTITRTVAYHPKTAGIAISANDADGMQIFGDNHVIRGNIMADIANPAENAISGTLAPHVDFFQSWDRAAVVPTEVIITDCLIENNYCWSDHPYSKALIIESVEGSAAAHNITVRNNIFEFRDAGIFIKQYSAGLPHHDIFIYNNVFTAKLDDAPWGGAIALNNVDNYKVFNNIMLDCHPVIREITGSGLVDYNFAWYSDNRTAHFTSPSIKPHERIGNPGLLSFSGIAGSNDYHLKADSSLLDQGWPETPVMSDFTGAPRPQGAGYDPGPYESGGNEVFETSISLPKWPDGKKAALIIQFDDGTPGHARLSLAAMDNHDLTGTWYINPGRDTYATDLALWESAPERGQELANHTMHHRSVSDEAEMEKEVEDAALEIWRIRGHAARGSLMGFCQSDSTSWNWSPETKQRILGDLRNVDRQSYPGLSYAGYTNHSVPTGASAATMYTTVPTIISGGNWGRISFHGIVSLTGTTDAGVGAVHIDELNQFLEMLVAVKSELWVAGQSELWKYSQERQNSSVNVIESCPDYITLDLVSILSALYDLPIDLEVRVPSSWKRCRAQQGTRTAVYPLLSANSAVVKAIPNGGRVILSASE